MQWQFFQVMYYGNNKRHAIRQEYTGEIIGGFSPKNIIIWATQFSMELCVFQSRYLKTGSTGAGRVKVIRLCKITNSRVPLQEDSSTTR